jgi:carbonic anhydrase
MSVFDELIAANARFAERRSPHLFPMPPARRLAVVTCMDARLDTARAFGIAEGDAHVIRNAGGRAIDALRSLVISQRLLGTRAVAVVHHTDCGMLTFSNPVLHAKVKEDLGADASNIDFLPFSSLEQSVRDDVALLESSPLLEPGTAIRGFIYDVRTGLVNEVESQATPSGVQG